MRIALLIAILGLDALLPAAVRCEGLRAGREIVLRAGGDGLRGTPAVACGDGLFLVAWREGWQGKGGSARVVAARVSADGRLLDPRGIDLAARATGVQERPRVAFCRGTFLVVWQELRGGKDYDVLAARMDASGKVLDRRPIAVSAGPRNQVLPDVAADRRQFLVVWQGLSGEETDFRGLAATVSVDGQVGSPVETRITPQPKIAWNGSHYLAVGGGSGAFAGSLRAVRLDASGTPQGQPAQVLYGTKAAAFCLSAVPGKGWLVVSHRSPPDPWGWGGPGAIRVASVDAEGRTQNRDALKEPAGVRQRLPGWLDMGLAKTADATWPWGPSAGAFDGRQVVVVWQRHHLVGQKRTNFANSDLFAARVDGFRSLDPAGVPMATSPGDERNPSLAGDGQGRLLLVYQRQADDGTVCVCARRLQND